MLSADDLGIFLEVARRGRLTEAAKHLGLNHTTVGRHISRLERTVEQRLFAREPSGWVLTDAGMRLLVHAEAVEAAVVAARDDCLLSGSKLSGSVRVIAPDGFGSFLLLPGLADLFVEYPDLTVEVVVANRHASLTSREFDIAVTIERPETRAVSVRRLGDYQLRLYAAPAYIAQVPKSVPLDQLADQHDFIWYVDEALGAATYRTLYQLVPAAKPRIQTNSIAGQIEAARCGLGVAFLPSYIGDRLDGLQRLPGVDAYVPHSYWLLTPTNLDRLAKVSAVSRWIEGLVANSDGLASPRPRG